MSRKALVLGGETGLLGMALAGALRDAGIEPFVTPRPSQRNFDARQLGEFIDNVAPDTVFNTWAYTQVDKAEDEPAEAMRINAELPEALGEAASGKTFKLVHFSTDFVFDGAANNPYTESDRPNPESVYGSTKLLGEKALLRKCPSENLLIIRTAWLFGPGKKNFVSTICGLAQERKRLSVVSDQQGSPTYTPDLAKYSFKLAESGASGIFHVVNSGRASWYELAAEAVKTAGIKCKIEPIPSDEYPQKAKRPVYSVLSTQKFEKTVGIKPRPWEKAVHEYVQKELVR